MVERPAVRRKIRHHFDTGTWPRSLTGVATLLLPASGVPCSACAEPLEDDSEIHIAYPSGPKLSLHLACERVWREEVRANPRADADAAEPFI